MKPPTKYNVIYADPPWSYDNKRTGGSMVSGADSKYLTTSKEDLRAMPINEITEIDALCFMWVTVPLFDEGIALLNAWGFKYKTLITWEKTGSLGMGHWMRVQTEHLIIGTKGKVKPFRCQEKNIYRLSICRHSAKPQFFRELVSRLSAMSFEATKRLELFARTREGMFGDYEYEGWDVYGNQCNNSITLPQ